MLKTCFNISNCPEKKINGVLEKERVTCELALRVRLNIKIAIA